MTRTSEDDSHRQISLEHLAHQTFKATNVRGGELTIGEGQSTDFTPVELLLVALAGCNALTVEAIAMKRATPTRFRVVADGNKNDMSEEPDSRLEDLRVEFDIEFDEDEAGQKAAARLPRALQQSHDRHCTVGRTIASGVDTELVLKKGD